MLFVRRVMLAVKRMLDMLGRGPARRTEEGHEHEPPAVETGHQRDDDADPEGEGTGDRAAYPGRLDDRILRPETGKAEARPDVDSNAGDRQRTNHHHPEGNRDVLPQRAVEA